MSNIKKDPGINITPIGYVKSDFSSKFGIPRQAGIVEELSARLVLNPETGSPETVRGLEEFSHIWLIWGFSENTGKGWHPTVRPPRLGGNERRGVYSTRSPFRPNPLAMSCVRLLGIEASGDGGMILHLGGADLMDGTPVYDIKPYIPYSDSLPDAKGGFAGRRPDYILSVTFPPELLEKIPEDKREALIKVLELDPRPAYHEEDGRIYGMEFAGFDIRFSVTDLVMTVVEVKELG